MCQMRWNSTLCIIVSMSIKRHIPNILTLLNLAVGMLATVLLIAGKPIGCTIALFVAFALDMADGMVARALKVHSPLGKELDSLADVVSFGVFPGWIMAELIHRSQYSISLFETLLESGLPSFPLFLVGFLIPMFSALRLGMFNLDERQSTDFFGLPTPANTLFIFSLYRILMDHPEGALAGVLNHSWGLIAITLVSCGLLVANIRLISGKFENLVLGEQWPRFVLIGVALIGLLLFQFTFVPFLLLFYLIFSQLYFRMNR